MAARHHRTLRGATPHWPPSRYPTPHLRHGMTMQSPRRRGEHRNAKSPCPMPSASDILVSAPGAPHPTVIRDARDHPRDGGRLPARDGPGPRGTRGDGPGPGRGRLERRHAGGRRGPGPVRPQAGARAAADRGVLGQSARPHLDREGGARMARRPSCRSGRSPRSSSTTRKTSCSR